LIITGCKGKETTEPEKVKTGNADFSVYVALGNSITAGYQSASLFESAQVYSYGNLIARQVNTTFEQPLISDPGTPGRMELLGMTSNGIPLITFNTSQGSQKNLGYKLPYNNLAVPGAVVYDLLHATSSADCYDGPHGSNSFLFDWILRNNILKIGSPFQQAKALKPTFITLWIGNNDILGYAMSGATGRFTPVSTFNVSYKNLVDSISSIHNVNMVAANIPDVLSIPFFTAVGDKFIQLGRTEVWGITGKGDTLLLSLKSNFLTLRALLTAVNSDGTLSNKGTVKLNPFQNSEVLDSLEIYQIHNIIDQYNEIINSNVSSKNYALVDINSFFKSLKNADQTGGTLINGINFKTDYITGGLFSLDGVHPSSRAQGLIANEFIKKINTRYSASIPLINVASIPETIVLGKEIKLSGTGLPIIKKEFLNKLQF
jgi:lysophospholipase L1-like esterase